MTPQSVPDRHQVTDIRDFILKCDNTLTQITRMPTWGLADALARVAGPSDIDWVSIEVESDHGQQPAGILRALSGAALIEVPFRTQRSRNGVQELAPGVVSVSRLRLSSFRVQVEAGDDEWDGWGVPSRVEVTLERPDGPPILLRSHDDGVDPEWNAAQALTSYAHSLRGRIATGPVQVA